MSRVIVVTMVIASASRMIVEALVKVVATSTLVVVMAATVVAATLVVDEGTDECSRNILIVFVARACWSSFVYI